MYITNIKKIYGFTTAHSHGEDSAGCFGCFDNWNTNRIYLTNYWRLREQPFIPLFYASIGGIIAVIIYSGYKGKKERQKANRERRRKSKK